MPDLGVNLVGRLAHAGILLDLLDDADGEHQKAGDTITTCARIAFCTTSSNPSCSSR